jgi:hypothetical protein
MMNQNPSVFLSRARRFWKGSFRIALILALLSGCVAACTQYQGSEFAFRISAVVILGAIGLWMTLKTTARCYDEEAPSRRGFRHYFFWIATFFFVAFYLGFLLRPMIANREFLALAIHTLLGFNICLALAMVYVDGTFSLSPKAHRDA